MRVGKWVTAALVVALVFSTAAMGATEEEKQAAIDAGLKYLANTQTTSGSEGYWGNVYNGTLAATATAALAFLEKGYTPGDGSAYDGVVTNAVNYVLNRATADGPGVYFDPGNYARSIYTTGTVAPVIHALGEAVGIDTVIGAGSGAISGLTYKQAMGEIMDWYAWGQNDSGWAEGGWGYSPNSGSSDNSTAQWGALPFLYGQAWGLATPQSVKDGLEIWTNRVQNTAVGDWREGGSGYGDMWNTVNQSKTGGMLLEFAVQGKSGDHADVEAALKFLNSTVVFDHWNQPASGWNGNKGNPYAMWAVYKGLTQYGLMTTNTDGIYVGKEMPGASGGIIIGFDGGPQYLSAPGDWYSDYCEWLVNNQSFNADGTVGWWNTPYIGWGNAMTAGWYINILNATGAPPPVVDPIPEPGSLALVGVGLLGFAWIARRRRRS